MKKVFSFVLLILVFGFIPFQGKAQAYTRPYFFNQGSHPERRSHHHHLQFPFQL